MNKKNKEKRKIKILFWGDSPACSTGFATVSRNILKPLAESGKYEIDIIGINDRGGWKDPVKHPYKIYPARVGIEVHGDYHGRPRLIAALTNKEPDLKPPWDIVFTLNDPFILEEPVPVFNEGTLRVVKKTQEIYKQKVKSKYHFKVVSYWPIDSTIKGNWVSNSVALADYPVAYTEYGKEEILRANKGLDKPTDIESRIRIITHGVNTKDFYPIPEKEKSEFRKIFFQEKVKPETFLAVVVARNQMRKDLPRTLQVFAEFLKRRPDSFLYLHCKESDAWGSLREYARNWPVLEFGKNWGCPESFEANSGFPIEAVNKIYNVADCVLSTSLGEGWGFYNSEGQATKTIVVGPNNTTHPEIFGYDADEDISNMDVLSSKVRGVPIKSGEGKSNWATYGPSDLERTRPLTDVDDAVKKLIWVYDNPDKVKEITERAYTWVQKLEWKNIVKQWDELFQEVYDKLEKERTKFDADLAKKIEEQSAKSKRTKRGQSSKTKK